VAAAGEPAAFAEVLRQNDASRLGSAAPAHEGSPSEDRPLVSAVDALLLGSAVRRREGAQHFSGSARMSPLAAPAALVGATT